MHPGLIIRAFRDQAGLTRKDLAKRAGVNDQTLKSYEQRRRQPSLAALKKLAHALGVSQADLVDDRNTGEVSVPNAALGPPTVPATQGGVWSRTRTIPGADASPDSLSVEELTKQGDDSASRGRFTDALDLYDHALSRMSRRDYGWARYQLERRAQVLIDLNDFPAVNDTLATVEREYQRSIRLERGAEDQRIRMLMDEKRAWRDTWEGHAAEAQYHAKQAYDAAQRLGDEPRVEETGLHFAARSACETTTTYMLYSRLTGAVQTDHNQLAEVVHRLARARALEERVGRDRSQAFNAQWESRARRAMGSSEYHEAKKLEQLWLGVFGQEEGSAEAQLDRARLVMLDEVDLHNAIQDARGILGRAFQGFQKWHYAPGIAEGLVTEAYIQFQEGKYRVSVASRRSMVDACLAATLCHPYPGHPIFRVAQALTAIAVRLMSDIEYEGYEVALPERIDAGDGEFRWMEFIYFQLPGFQEEALRTLRLARIGMKR